MHTLDNGLIIVEHGEWSKRATGSRSNGKPRIPLGNGLHKVFIHHSVTIAQGDPAQIGHLDPSDDPCADARRVEAILAERGLLPGYSYLVHPSGVILECAGDYVGAHTEGHNSSSVAFCLIGNFDKQQPTLAALVNISRSINLLRWSGRLASDFDKLLIMGHRHVGQTACPGVNVANVLNNIRDMAIRGV